METRPRDPQHGDLARGWDTLSPDERLGSFVDGDETEPHTNEHQLEISFLESDAEANSLTFGWSGDGDR